MNYADRKFTNLDIARTFLFSIDQVRRWALVAFPADVSTEWGKGKKREYDIDETFKIFLISVLCSTYNMSLSEAKIHIDNLWLILKEFNLLPSQLPTEMIEGEGHLQLGDIDMQIYIHPGNYEFWFPQESHFISGDESKSEFIETYKRIIFNLKKDIDHSTRTWIDYGEQLIHFFDAIRMAFAKGLEKSRSLREPVDLRKKIKRLLLKDFSD